MSQEFELAGYTVVNRVVSETQCAALIASLPSLTSSGTRRLLAIAAYRELAAYLRAGPLSHYLGGLVAVEGILFRKSIDHNWAVRLHRDTVLPINGSGAWKPSGTKEGMLCAKPPRPFLDDCVAVRVHLDGTPIEDISIVPGSHLDASSHDRQRAKPVAVPRCGALVMRPTVSHASSKLSSVQQRRVLHIVYAPQEVPHGYAWYDAA